MLKDQDTPVVSTLCFIGIDVSQKSLDISMFPTHRCWTIPNESSALLALAEELRAYAVERIVLEATGGLETLAASLLASQGLPVVIINPRQARDFAKATGKLAKTDRIDASVLAHFAQAICPPLRDLKEEEQRELQALLTRRSQLIDMSTAEKNRLARSALKVKKNIEEHLAWLKKRLQEIDQELSNFIRQSPLWKDKHDLLKSVPGIGKVTLFTLLADFPELGTLNRKQTAALAGLAPFNRDSGVFKGSRSVWGGRARVRSTLYMATLAAIRSNLPIKLFYERLIKAGKKPKVAITACMRKLLVILNTMLKYKTLWTPHLAAVT